MEGQPVKTGENLESSEVGTLPPVVKTAAESAKRVSKAVKSSVGTGTTKTAFGPVRNRTDLKTASNSTTNVAKSSSSGIKSTSNLTKPTLNGSSGVPVIRRNSTGGFPEKQSAVSTTARRQSSTSSTVGKKLALVPQPLRCFVPEIRSSLPSVLSKSMTRSSILENRKSGPVSPGTRSLRSSIGSDSIKQEIAKRSVVKPASSASSSSSTTGEDL